MVHLNIGDYLSAQDDKDGALAEMRAAVDAFTALVAKDPNNTRWQADLANSHDEIGSVLKARNVLTGAVQEYKAELAVRTQLAAKDPENVDWLHELERRS